MTEIATSDIRKKLKTNSIYLQIRTFSKIIDNVIKYPRN